MVIAQLAARMPSAGLLPEHQKGSALYLCAGGLISIFPCIFPKVPIVPVGMILLLVELHCIDVYLVTGESLNLSKLA